MTTNMIKTIVADYFKTQPVLKAPSSFSHSFFATQSDAIIYVYFCLLDWS